MKRLLIILTLGLIHAGQCMAQQDPVVSQYMFNGLLLNPAYAGSKEYFSTTLLHRSQWVNWGEGAPQTQVFTFHARLKDQVNGVGLMVSNDHLGVTNQTDIYANYAYHIPMGDKHRLSLGLRGGFSYYRAELNKLIYWDQNDEIFSKGVITDLVPNAGTGAYLYSRRFYAGLSVPHLLSYDPREMFHLGNEVTTIPHIRRHYMFTTGYAFEVSHNVVVKPSILLKYVKNAPIQADFNCNVLLNNLIWIGASYRTGDSFVGMLELQATKRFRIGYAYDYTLTNIQNYSAGSHEIMLGYDFGYQVLKMKTPRYF